MGTDGRDLWSADSGTIVLGKGCPIARVVIDGAADPSYLSFRSERGSAYS
jgi:hypothetical protein